MNIEKMREEFEAAFMRELEVDLSGHRHTDDDGLECYQFDGDDHDERSKLASIAFMFWQASRELLVIDLSATLEESEHFCEPGVSNIYRQAKADIRAAGVRTK